MTICRIWTNWTQTRRQQTPVPYPNISFPGSLDFSSRQCAMNTTITVLYKIHSQKKFTMPHTYDGHQAVTHKSALLTSSVAVLPRSPLLPRKRQIHRRKASRPLPPRVSINKSLSTRATDYQTSCHGLVSIYVRRKSPPVTVKHP